MSKSDCENQTVIQKGKKGEAKSSIKEETVASRMEIEIERYVDERKEDRRETLLKRDFSARRRTGIDGENISSAYSARKTLRFIE